MKTNQSAMADLKPCPFCGKPPVATVCSDLTDNFDHHYSIACHECGFEICDEYRSGVAENWNNRAAIPLPVQEAVRWEAHDETCDSDNFATSIYEADYDGLLVARCNQNGNHPWQASAIIRGLTENKSLPAPSSAGVVREWQPIDTAPKDGVFCWVGHECGFMEPAYFKLTGAGFWVNVFTGLPVPWKPRLWQSYPAAPQPKQEGV